MIKFYNFFFKYLDKDFKNLYIWNYMWEAYGDRWLPLSH